MNTPYPVIMFGTDASVFDPKSDAAMRMQDYAKLYESIHIVTSARDPQGRPVIQLSDTVFVYPSRHAFKPLALWGIYQRSRQLMREYGIRCVMSQDPFALGFVAYLLAKEFRGVFAVAIYGFDINDLFFRRESLVQRLQMTIAPFVLRRADAIQTDGPETVDYLKERYGNKVFFKPMFPSNKDELSHLTRSVSDTPFKLLFVGRFSLQKNPELLSDVIIACARELGSAVHFTLVGSGALKAELLGKIRRAGAENNITDAGVLNRQEILNMYATHHALVLTSYDEGFPRVFMEAALAGMPVITTDVGGVRDLIVNEESGYVLPQGATADDFVTRIKALEENRPLLARFSAAIKERWNRLYGNKTVLDYQRPLVEFLGSRIRS